MTEKIRKPIGKRKKLPQFTIMNVIEGQAGLENYSSLFFYSLTIDNILNIIVLLILAGIALNLTIGENGLFTRAQNAANTWQLAEQNEQNAMNSLASWIDSVSGEKDNNNQTEPTYTNIFAQLYANGDGTETLIFTSDENYREEGKELKDGWDITDEHFSAGEIMNIPPWLDESTDYENSTIKTVKIVNEIKPKYTSVMFALLTALENIEGMEKLNTENTVDMSWMFSGCESLTSLDLSSFDTSNVTNMSDMFSSCDSLTSLNLSSFDTSNVTNMSNMFSVCQSLTELDLSSFDTSNVTNMSSMFDMDMRSELKLITFGDKFNTNNVTNMSWMFAGCENLEELDLSSFNTSNVTDMSHMFGGCTNLLTISVGPNWTTAANADYMFNGCGTDQVTPIS